MKAVSMSFGSGIDIYAHTNILTIYAIYTVVQKTVITVVSINADQFR